MGLRGGLIAVSGLLATLAVLFTIFAPEKPSTPVADAARAEPATTSVARGESDVPGPRVGEKVALAGRDVTPDGITPAPRVHGPLIRIEGVRPPPPEPRAPVTSLTLRPVLVVDGGTLRSQDAVVRLARIEALQLNATCTADGGEIWPCGKVARTALRKLIRGRAVICARADGGSFDEAVAQADCVIGNQNISDWLVEYGWALPVGDDRAELLAAAKDKNRGQWRRAGLPSLVPVSEPAIDTPSLAERLAISVPDERTDGAPYTGIGDTAAPRP